MVATPERGWFRLPVTLWNSLTNRRFQKWRKPKRRSRPGLCNSPSLVKFFIRFGSLVGFIEHRWQVAECSLKLAARVRFSYGKFAAELRTRNYTVRVVRFGLEHWLGISLLSQSLPCRRCNSRNLRCFGPVIFVDHALQLEKQVVSLAKNDFCLIQSPAWLFARTWHGLDLQVNLRLLSLAPLEKWRLIRYKLRRAWSTWSWIE